MKTFIKKDNRRSDVINYSDVKLFIDLHRVTAQKLQTYRPKCTNF